MPKHPEAQKVLKCDMADTVGLPRKQNPLDYLNRDVSAVDWSPRGWRARQRMYVLPSQEGVTLPTSLMCGLLWLNVSRCDIHNIQVASVTHEQGKAF